MVCTLATESTQMVLVPVILPKIMVSSPGAAPVVTMATGRSLSRIPRILKEAGNIFLQKYQLSHIRGGKSHIQKSLAVWKPELERYTGLVQQIKEKSKERKALVKLRLIGGTSVGFFQKIIDDFGLGQHKVDEKRVRLGGLFHEKEMPAVV